MERLALADVAVVTGRAESVAHESAHREAYDLALARAVASLPVLLELALPFLRLGGFLAAPKGSRATQEVAAAAAALQACGGRILVARASPRFALDAGPGGEGGPDPLRLPAPSRHPRQAPTVLNREDFGANNPLEGINP